MTTDQLSALLAQDPAAVLEHDRRLYEQQIVRAADLIAAHAQERPAVLLAGPSGSGKTTTALLIERELDRRGMETHTLSMDDYFCPLTERELELFSRNELDLERPSRVGGVFQALGNSVYSMIVSIARQLVVLLPVAYLLSLSGNIDAVWFAFPIAEVASLAMTVILFLRLYRKKIRPLSRMPAAE